MIYKQMVEGNTGRESGWKGLQEVGPTGSFGSPVGRGGH